MVVGSSAVDVVAGIDVVAGNVVVVLGSTVVVVVEVDEVVVVLDDVVVVDEVVVVDDVVVVGSGGKVVVDSTDEVVVVGVLCQADARNGKKLNRTAGSGISQRLYCFISVPCSEY